MSDGMLEEPRLSVQPLSVQKHIMQVSHTPIENYPSSCSKNGHIMDILVKGWKEPHASQVAFVANTVPSHSRMIYFTRGGFKCYRTTDLDLVSSVCGLKVVCHHLPRNHGRDAAAFYFYASTYYDDLPKYLVVLHGEMGDDFRNPYITISSRIRHFVNYPVHVPMDLVSNTTMFTRLNRLSLPATGWYSGRRLQLSERQNRTYCKSILDDYLKETALELKPVPGATCCASWIMQANLIRKYPLQLYKNLFSCQMAHHDDQAAGRHAYEFVVHSMYSHPPLPSTDEKEAWYKAAYDAWQ